MKKNRIVISLILISLLVVGLIVLAFFYPTGSKFAFLTIALSVLLELFGYAITKKWYILFVTTLIAAGLSFLVWLFIRDSIIPITLSIFFIDVLLLGLYLALNKDQYNADNVRYSLDALPIDAV